MRGENTEEMDWEFEFRGKANIGGLSVHVKFMVKDSDRWLG